MERKKRRCGDRLDGYRLHDMDALHAIMPFAVPRRTDNEAVMVETIDLTAINEYLADKNVPDIDFKYTFFHIICAALAKTIALRPGMNRFYAGKRLYQRNNIVLSFVVKKQLTDDGAEAGCLVTIDPENELSPVEQVYRQVKKVVFSIRRENKPNGTIGAIDKLLKLPRPILSFVMFALSRLDYHGMYPASLMRDDPYFSSVFISNLGSIKMHASYHHLANWGTNSLFVLVGEKRWQPVFSQDGSYVMHEMLDLGLTVDERIADGVYFASSVRLLQRLLQDPSLLDLPLMQLPD